MISRDRLLGALRTALSEDGFQVAICLSDREGIELARYDDFDAIVLDIARDGSCGTATIRAFRNANITAPLIVICTGESVSARVEALNLGADDCLTRPIHKAELVARLHATVRRIRAQTHSTVKIGNLEIDLSTKEVRICNQPMHLTRSEYRMLELLALRRNSIVSKETMLERLYEGRDEPETGQIVNVFLSKLRKKIKSASGGESYITTVWGGGYRLRAPVTPKLAA